jgi:hypothetical protein
MPLDASELAAALAGLAGSEEGRRALAQLAEAACTALAPRNGRAPHGNGQPGGARHFSSAAEVLMIERRSHGTGC